jgi:hypothetical protein
MNDQIKLFEYRFTALHERSIMAVGLVESEKLFLQPLGDISAIRSLTFGESLLRSAAAVEQTFGGLTTRLWDDPFEWTLPEELSTSEKIKSYLNEVEETRKKGFRSLTSDADLMRQIPAPENLTPILELLLQTLARAEHYQGRAFAVLQLISEHQIPRRLLP